MHHTLLKTSIPHRLSAPVHFSSRLLLPQLPQTLIRHQSPKVYEFVSRHVECTPNGRFGAHPAPPSSASLSASPVYLHVPLDTILLLSSVIVYRLVDKI